MAWLSLRAYAKHRQCSLSAVQRAIESGRLRASVGRDGQGHPKITDAAAADAEWTANTHAEKAPIAIQMREAARAPASVPPPPSSGEDGEPVNPMEARARLDMAKAELAELELAERRGELVEVKEVDARLTTLFGQCKTRLMGVPSRARQQDPALTVAQVALIDALIREALVALADGKLEGEAAEAGAA